MLLFGKIIILAINISNQTFKIKSILLFLKKKKNRNQN